METADALFERLTRAPPRTLEIVRLAVLLQEPLEALASRYRISVSEAKVLVFRALLHLAAEGRLVLSDEEEARALDQLEGAPGPVATVVAALSAHRQVLLESLDAAARAYAQAPERRREDRLRYVMIVVVLVLSAYFYWREQQRSPPPSPPARVRP